MSIAAVFSPIRPTSAPNAAEPLDALRRRAAAAAAVAAVREKMHRRGSTSNNHISSGKQPRSEIQHNNFIRRQTFSRHCQGQ